MSERSQFGLLTERRFLPLFLTQFFGAANRGPAPDEARRPQDHSTVCG